jgi:hypothetical protein
MNIGPVKHIVAVVKVKQDQVLGNTPPQFLTLS